MANRLVDNVFIIDSQTNAVALNWLRDSKIASIAFWGADTSSVLELALSSDTTNVIARFSIIDQVVGATPSGTALSNQPNSIYFGGVRFSALAVKTLTAGTGWIYFI